MVAYGTVDDDVVLAGDCRGLVGVIHTFVQDGLDAVAVGRGEGSRGRWRAQEHGDGVALRDLDVEAKKAVRMVPPM